MSAVTWHLKQGSLLPPKVEGKLRLYSNKYCPYAQRVRMVLLVKNIPHDIVNINLQNKPEWLFKLNDKGKVPIIDTGSEVIAESLDICDFLDKNYPNKPLYPTNEKERAQDKALIDDASTIISLFYQIAWKKEHNNLPQYEPAVVTELTKFENELEKRGTFFGGEEPKMVDFMIWPWAERVGVIKLMYGEELSLPKTLTRVFKWCAAMRIQPAVQETFNPTEAILKIARGHVTDKVNNISASSTSRSNL